MPKEIMSIRPAMAQKKPDPVIAKRDPCATDIGQSLTTLWLNENTNDVFILTEICGNEAIWKKIKFEE